MNTKVKLVIKLLASLSLVWLCHGCTRGSQGFKSVTADTTRSARGQGSTEPNSRSIPFVGTRLYPSYRGMYRDIRGMGYYIELEISSGPKLGEFKGKGRLTQVEMEDKYEPMYSSFDCDLKTTSDSSGVITITSIADSSFGKITVTQFSDSLTTQRPAINYRLSDSGPFAYSALWGIVDIHVKSYVFQGSILLHCFGE